MMCMMMSMSIPTASTFEMSKRTCIFLDKNIKLIILNYLTHFLQYKMLRLVILLLNSLRDLVELKKENDS
jgi:hypothetical protein